MTELHPFRCCGLWTEEDEDGEDWPICGDCGQNIQAPHDGFIPLGALNTDELL